MSSQTATIDWLSYTVHWNTEALHRFRKAFNLDLAAAALTNQTGAWVPEKPLHGYAQAVSFASSSGLRVMASKPNSPMGIHVSWSGSALQEVNPRAVLRAALAMGANITRIDIAIDTPSEPTWASFEVAWVNGEVTTRARDYRQIKSNRGRTFYVGSRTSEKFLRIYDKAAESGIGGPLTRIELECKHDYADGVARHIDANGYDYFADIIKGFCDFPTLSWWRDNMTSPTLLEGIPKKEKRSDTFAWLMEQVAPSAARLMVNDHEKFVSFLRKVYTLAGVGDGVGEADPFDGAADWEPRPRH